MIPLRDSTPSKRFPIVTVLLIIVNCYIFLRGISSGIEFEGIFCKYAIIPANYVRIEWLQLDSVLQNNITLVSALFLHGGWIHLLGNMWYLWIFGDNVEDRLGHFGFLLFYLLCGIIGNLAHIFMNTGSSIPAIGASGCIAGVLGAYFIMFPTAKVVTLLPIFIFWTIAEIRAFFFLGIWFAIQFLNGFFPLLGSKNALGIAWWAHIGGFICGITFSFMFFSRKKRRRR